ncbi:MAG: hypothetical protein KAJ73_00460 [Zetaproteobacteria bacterium]|nr:hypothetical protein [Zetaproteobacteria bacterium]
MTAGTQKEMVIDFSPAGPVEGMHFDQFDLNFLGKKKVTRASEIFHNGDSDKWDIILPGDDFPCCEAATGFPGYDTARQFEVNWLQECRKIEVAPDSKRGIAMAMGLRTEDNT